MTEIRISVRNTSDDGGTFLTPFWFAFHDNSFDLYDRNVASSAGLEALAEDGSFDTINSEVMALDEDAQVGAVFGAGTPPVLTTRELASTIVDVDAVSNGYIDIAAMILPSNDAFIGTGTSLEIFDDDGNFLGPQRVSFSGADVLDAGTEVNTELDAAFLNQTGPNTGEDEFGVVTSHPGFIGSEGNPGEGGSILGGTGATGVAIDPVIADFTRDGAEIALVRINEVNNTTGTDGKDNIIGNRADDLVDAGDGNDLVFGRLGWDDIDGGAGNDRLFGNIGQDQIFGGAGDDFIGGGIGADILAGGTGDDTLRGGAGRDTFIYSEGDGNDLLFNLRPVDTLVLDVDGIESVSDLVEAATAIGADNVQIDFGDDDGLLLIGVGINDLSNLDIDFL